MSTKKVGMTFCLILLLISLASLALGVLDNPFTEKDSYHKEDGEQYNIATEMLENLGYNGNSAGLKDFQNDHDTEINTYRNDVNYESITPANDGKLGYGTIEALNNQWNIKKQEEEREAREKQRQQELEERAKTHSTIGGESNGLGEGISKIFGIIISIGSLEFLLGGSADSQFCGFIRIALAILIFAILYMVLGAVNNATGGDTLPKNIAITISIVLTIVTAIFIPCSVMMTFGSTYAVLFSLLIIGGPMVGIGWLVFGTPTESRGVAALKLFGILLLWWLISEIAHWAGQIM